MSRRARSGQSPGGRARFTFSCCNPPTVTSPSAVVTYVRSYPIHGPAQLKVRSRDLKAEARAACEEQASLMKFVS